MQVVCKTLCKTWKAKCCPLYLALTLPPPPPHFSFFFFFFFCFLKNLLRLKINILSSIYPEINFPAQPVIKINNLSRPKVPAPPPPPSESNGRPLMVKTYPCQNVPNQKLTYFFGQNVPSPPKRTQTFGQNVPIIFFTDIQYIFTFWF